MWYRKYKIQIQINAKTTVDMQVLDTLIYMDVCIDAPHVCLTGCTILTIIIVGWGTIVHANVCRRMLTSITH